MSTSPTPPSPSNSNSTAKALPWILLGLMSLLSFGGPFAIYLVLRGGDAEGWPPDRPVEWWFLGVVTGLVVVLMTACVTLGRWSKPKAPTSANIPS